MATITLLEGTRFLIVCPGADDVQFCAFVDQATISEPAELSAEHGAPTTLLSSCFPVICSYASLQQCCIAFARTASDAAGIAKICAHGDTNAVDHWIMYRTAGYKIYEEGCACCAECLVSMQKTYAYYNAIGNIPARDAFVARVIAHISVP